MRPIPIIINPRILPVKPKKKKKKEKEAAPLAGPAIVRAAIQASDPSLIS
jgi:hypothetical protein